MSAKYCVHRSVYFNQEQHREITDYIKQSPGYTFSGLVKHLLLVHVRSMRGVSCATNAPTLTTK